MSKPRLSDIDIAKGIAIALVVFGHIYAGPDNAWYTVTKHAIYRFHMPFFMFLSGLLFFYTYRPVSSYAEYKDYAQRKICRFVHAYFFFSVLIFLGKTSLSKILHVDNPPKEFFLSFVSMFIYPTHSHARELWYVYVLSCYYLAVPVLMTLTKNRIGWLLLLSLPLYFVPAPQIFLIKRSCEYMFFFLLGGLVSEHYEYYSNVVDKYAVPLCLFFFGLFACQIFLSLDIQKIAMGLVAIPALHALARSRYLRDSRVLGLLGLYTFPIYLMNTIVIGLVKGGMLKITDLNGYKFIVASIILLISGLFVPVLLKKKVFPKVPFLDRLTN